MSANYRVGLYIPSTQLQDDFADTPSEVSAGSRAGCQATHCKKENVKIQKGELRQGVYVDIGGNQSWKWRHW